MSRPDGVRDVGGAYEALSARRYRAYPDYKDSGVEWLGGIPEHWKLSTLRFCLKPQPGSIKTGPFGSQLTSADMMSDAVKVYNQRTVLDKNFRSGENFISEKKYSEMKSFTVFPGDLLITTRGTIGRCVIAPPNIQKGILHPCLMRIQVNPAIVDPHFMELLIQDSYLILGQLKTMSNATTIEVIYSESLKRVQVILPSIEEQQHITRFVDHQIQKINGLIAAKQELLTLLKEKRQAVITHAVTKGLDTNVKFKPSRIDWLGEVPEHWEINRLNRLCNRITDGSHISPDLSSPDFRFVSTVDIKEGDIDFENCLRTSKESYEYLVRTGCKPRKGDVLFSKDGTIGKTYSVREDRDFVVASSLVIIPPKHKLLHSRFVEYWLKNSLLQQHVLLQISGAALRRISVEKVSRLPIVLPSLEEQKVICEHLDSETAKINKLSTEIEKAITKLQEYRTALISAAVTGKIDVRGCVP